MYFVKMQVRFLPIDISWKFHYYEEKFQLNGPNKKS